MRDKDKISFWIDDVKTPDFYVDLICRNGLLALSLLYYLKVSDLYIDHDLGEGINGAEILKELFIAKHKDDLPETIFIISNNPVGRDNMRNIILDTDLYFEDNAWKFIKIN